jgi:hypothetical protein
VKVPIRHLALAAHLNALIGGLWLMVVAPTLVVCAASAIGLAKKRAS